MSQPKRYIAFVSYSHSDRRWARWVHQALETYRVPGRLQLPAETAAFFSGRLSPIFLDREELSTSSSLADSIREALVHSHYLVVVCSPRSAASRWVNEEVRLFKALGGSRRILCLIVEGEPNASPSNHGGEECFAPALRHEVINGEITQAPAAELLAADVRPGMDSPRDARLKLVAGLLGVNLDELRRRDQTRRQKRLAWVAASALAGCVTLAGLSVAALVSRSEAQRQRLIAEQKSLTAQRTADFMKSLFEVSDPSEARGNSITAREMLDRGVRQIRTGLKSEPLVRAELMTTLGEVYTGLGLYKEGSDLLGDASRVSGQPMAVAARQLVARGEIEFLQGNYEQSGGLFAQAIEQLRGQEHGDDTLLIRALAGRGEVLTENEQYTEARRSFDEALQVTGHLPGTNEATRARISEGLGDIAFFSGDLNTAERRYREALELRMQSSGENHPKVAITLDTLGSIAYMRGDPAAAARMYERALPIERRVLGERHPEVGITLNNLARVYLEQRKFARAASLLEESMSIRLAELGETHDDMAFIYSNLALARVGLGDDAAAGPLFDKALRAAVLHNHRLHGAILTDLAALDCRNGRYDEGLKRLDEARPLLTERYPDEPWRAALVDNVRGGCLMDHGQLDAAEPLLTTSTEILLNRWGADRLYGYDALQRTIRLYTRTQNEIKLAEYRKLVRR